MSTHTHLVAGVVISVVSAVLYNVGFVLEKHALDRMPPVHARRLVHLLTQVASSPLWVAGFVLLLAGLALQVLALSLVSISVVQPIFVSGIVILLVLSHVSLKEHLGRREWGAVCVVALSLLAISLSLDASSDHAGSSGAFGSLVLAAIPTVLVAGWLFETAERVEGRPGARPARTGTDVRRLDRSHVRRGGARHQGRGGPGGAVRPDRLDPPRAGLGLPLRPASPPRRSGCSCSRRPCSGARRRSSSRSPTSSRAPMSSQSGRSSSVSTCPVRSGSSACAWWASSGSW